MLFGLSFLQCGRPGFDPWVGKILWRRKWQPTPVLLPGKSHGQRSVVGYSPRGRKESDTTEQHHFTSLWSLLESIPGPLEKNVYSVMLNEMFWMCLVSLFLLKCGSMFKTCSIAMFPYWLCLDNRAIADSGILKFPKITVWFSIYPLRSFIDYSLYFRE